MKNYLLISALCILNTAFLMGDLSKDRDVLLAAIKESDATSVQKIVREVGSFTQDEKNELLKAAENVSNKREVSLSLWKGRLGKGRIACFLVSVSAFVVVAVKNKDVSFKEFCKSAMAVTIPSAVAGIAYNKLEQEYLFKAGFFFGQAKRIESIIILDVSSNQPTQGL